MYIRTRIKAYFDKKKEGIETGAAPETICPNCWGNQEWDGHFYELTKGTKLIPNEAIYESFISKIVVSNIVGVKINSDTYSCLTCKMEYN